MDLRDDDCYVALKARDARFDGQFFTCVKSTGIYCRPICPARTPRRANCDFVASAAAAEDAGFRACLRCRPESAPGSPEWLGSESIVHRALRTMSETSADELSLERMSGDFGISSRQLRRLFAERLGTSPKSIVQTNRIALARQLLVDTRLPVADVAMAAGFGSIRRFNTAVRSAFGMTPTALRNKHGSPLGNHRAILQLGYRPPYAWDQLLDHFAARGIARLEAVDEAYVRAIQIGEARGHVSVTHDAKRHCMRVEFLLDRNTDLSPAIAKVRDLLDLDALPIPIASHLSRDRRLRKIVNANPGLRLPGAWSIFEILIRAIVGQQVSVPAARTVLGRLVAGLGEPVATGDGDNGSRERWPDRLFPEPEALAGKSLQPFGLNTARAQTINRVAELFCADARYINGGMRFDIARRRLLEIKGIGPWTADYVLLRALRYPDAFPAADLGALKAAGVDKPRELAAIAERWRPWRGYALMYLWKSLETQQ